MPESAYTTVTELLTKALQQSAVGGEKGFALDGVVEKLSELAEKLRGRKEIIDKLKSKMSGGGIKAKDWTPLQAQIDYLSRVERDLTVRYMTRVGCLRKRTESHELGVKSIEAADKILSKIEQG